VSLGAGNCDAEIRVAQRIRELGLEDFTIECIDINEAMLARGAASAAAEGVAAHIVPLRADFNEWSPKREYAGVMANQSLHHMVELEKVFDAVKAALMPRALFVVSDMIGRNGHLRWPEALTAVHRFWQELPNAYRYNQQLQRAEPLYENWDCSSESFEGIRAQDILPLLLERFHFEVFIAFANVVDVFIDRGFGHNFDPGGDWDRAFVDRVHAFDEAGFQNRTLTPTHLIGALSQEPPLEEHRSRGLDPTECVHPPLL
jgi:SAM-dependent methyltransferase